ncbi:jupiter microtubule associated homolog 1a [Neoarius graeffei]|uniref:jupiter microtubule associated homolog 1a n=1 Tax=Neoarius graeffei TaxID=443677 RepID=UPI00298BE109|nr:jupiter microtubule associated homolog 1a [Neoarius graeffei]XP_060774551.1 jupiter microtubule associated homolog 1a [Neoarius graeffei]
MTTTTTFQGMDPDAKSSSRVLRPPGGGSNICFGTEEEKSVTRKNKMASSIFAEPEDPHAHRRNNPPGGKPTGVLCGEPSAPLRRCVQQPVNQTSDAQEEPSSVVNGDDGKNTEPVEAVEAAEEVEASPMEKSAPSASSEKPSGRRNPPGGKSSLILG